MTLSVSRRAFAMGGAVTLASAPALAQSSGASDRLGYLFVMGNVSNPEVIAGYAKTLPPIYAKYQGIYVATGTPGKTAQVLEGNFKAQSVLIARFPSPDAVNEFWWSPEYRKSAQMRIGAGAFDVLRLKGRPGETSAPPSKAGYLVALEVMKFPEKMQAYAEKARPVLAAYGGKIISSGGRKDIELLEGVFGNRQITIVRFDSLKALRAFYNDPAYQAAIPLRQEAADCVVLEMEGV